MDLRSATSCDRWVLKTSEKVRLIIARAVSSRDIAVIMRSCFSAFCWSSANAAVTTAITQKIARDRPTRLIMSLLRLESPKRILVQLGCQKEGLICQIRCTLGPGTGAV